jgi:UDP-N-acetylmuramyl pentapeptide synthase
MRDGDCIAKIYITINNKNRYFYFNTCFDSDIKNLLASILIVSIYKNINKLDYNFFYNHKILTGSGDISKIKLSTKNFYLIDQSYNSNPLSLDSAYNLIQNWKKTRRAEAVLGCPSCLSCKQIALLSANMNLPIKVG